jgi:glycerophosphoryl diester phosphodiesterase
MLIFAHRGVHDRRTGENTVTAFKRAHELGVDGVEFDLRISRDGVPVAIHDENLRRVAGDARRVRDLTSRELKQIILRGRGNIPTLNDITSSVPRPTLFDIEIKDREVLDILIKKLKTSNGLRKRVIVSSFVLDDLIRVCKGVPDVRTLYLNRAWPLPLRRRVYIKKLTSAHVWCIGFPYNLLNKKRVAWLHENRFAVASWDLQPLRSQARRVVGLGVDVGIVYRVDAV